ncbi:hypothetical protein AB0J40_45495 [Amycolatopsis sp. NPDC049691]|uniref:hypothetical protein n=1 Tax=Amycolatopsis sp. NPDC049691 TaxID=3155155 RepID=UPI0034163B61
MITTESSNDAKSKSARRPIARPTLPAARTRLARGSIAAAPLIATVLYALWMRSGQLRGIRTVAAEAGQEDIDDEQGHSAVRPE